MKKGLLCTLKMLFTSQTILRNYKRIKMKKKKIGQKWRILKNGRADNFFNVKINR
jgi:hypothetical protein